MPFSSVGEARQCRCPYQASASWQPATKGSRAATVPDRAAKIPDRQCESNQRNRPAMLSALTALGRLPRPRDEHQRWA